MKLDKRTEQIIINDTQEAYNMRDMTTMFGHTIKFNTFVVEVDEWDNELYATVLRRSDGQIFENISNYIEKELLDKYIKLD